MFNFESGWLLNLTETTILTEVIDIVSLGFNYSILQNISKNKVIIVTKNVESTISSFDICENSKNKIRETMSNIIIQNLNNIRHISKFKKTFLK